MANISNNGFITVHRGDTFSVPLFLNIGTHSFPVRYILSDHPEDTLYIGVMSFNETFDNASIRKKYDAKSTVNEYKDIIVSFSSEDTLSLMPGKYYYEIKLKHGKENVETVVPRTEFFIVE